MRPSFVHNLVNGPFEDPSLFVRILGERQAMLFDIGDISRLGPGDLQKITDVFVTHTHIDHFIGLDHLLRAVLHRETPLTIYGPANIIDCVQGKLRGYTWNLVREYPLKIVVIGIDGGRIEAAEFYAAQGFRRTDRPPAHFTGTLLETPVFVVRAVQLDHKIPSLGFCLEEKYHININKALLSEMGLPVGPWLAELKKAIREDLPGNTEFTLSGRQVTLDRLRVVATITKGQKISYITDSSLSSENVDRITGFVHASDTLYCEAYFLDKDRERARERFHLTARAAGMIGRNANVQNLTLMHFSPKYRDIPESVQREAMEEFLRR